MFIYVCITGLLEKLEKYENFLLMMGIYFPILLSFLFHFLKQMLLKDLKTEDNLMYVGIVILSFFSLVKYLHGYFTSSVDSINKDYGRVHPVVSVTLLLGIYLKIIKYRLIDPFVCYQRN